MSPRSLRPPVRWLVALSMLAVSLTSESAQAADKRPEQDYGVAPPKQSGWLWVPRVVFFPLFLISNYVLREPAGALVRVAERDDWADRVTDFFSFGSHKQVTVYPSALFDFGLKPSVGFNLTWKHLGAEANTAKLHFGTWGPDWISVRATDTYDMGSGQSLGLDAHFVRRDDQPFFGLGPRSAQRDLVRYGVSDASVALVHTTRLWRSSSFSTSAGIRALSFRDGGCCDDPSLRDAIDAGRFTTPPGLDQGYTASFQRASLAIDSREPRPAPGSGVRAEAHAQTTFALDERNGAGHRSFVHYGGAIGAMIDLTGTQRVLALSVDAELVDPLLGVVPFTDLVTLGGDVLMRGYLRGRLVDRSALVAKLEYTWPIWVYLDGVIDASLGNVFGERFAGFDSGLLRMSSGIGLRSNGNRESGFDALLAFGTDPIDEGFRPSSVRIVLGSHHGF